MPFLFTVFRMNISNISKFYNINYKTARFVNKIAYYNLYSLIYKCEKKKKVTKILYDF